ncbi:hypothetical protein F4814DRAFT_400688 [Daldinia grandis]|nr:hypothetical protein F4814DRAFT_400688 [Daldinia grandis]
MFDKLRKKDTIRCLSLIMLSLFFLPSSISILCFRLFTSRVSYYRSGRRSENRAQQEFFQETILVTGVGMAKGLTLARSFCVSGHRVIGADFEDPHIPCPGRYSRSLSAFHRLSKPNAKNGTQAYIGQLVDVIRTEDVKLWVSCSGVTNAIEDAEAKEFIEKHTSCKCIQFGVQTTSTLHDKGLFMEECKKLGLPIPETHLVKSKPDVFRILSDCVTLNPKGRYILKPVGLDDIHRGNLTVLPLKTEEETRTYISQLPISDSNPWILQQYISGGKEYCTHALVVEGRVKCFLACPSSEFLMKYEPLQESALWKAMLAFTVEFVRRSPNSETMTGHLSFDFMASEEDISHQGFKRNIYAIECNPRAHTAVVLFGHQGPEAYAMVQAYLALVQGNQEMNTADSIPKQKLLARTEGPIISPPANAQPRYWIGHDLVSLFLYPLFRWSIRPGNSRRIATDVLEFISHVLLWKEGTFEIWDPLPALILYHVYWPMTILSAWWQGNNWSRINVSTTKMFAC